MLKEVGAIVRKELKVLCKKSAPSILRRASHQMLKTFTWDVLINELKEKSPTLVNFLNDCVSRKRRK